MLQDFFFACSSFVVSSDKFFFDYLTSVVMWGNECSGEERIFRCRMGVIPAKRSNRNFKLFREWNAKECECRRKNAIIETRKVIGTNDKWNNYCSIVHVAIGSGITAIFSITLQRERLVVVIRFFLVFCDP